MRGRIDRNEKGASAMLLAIDIGNSNISVGLFDQKRDLKFLSSIDTDSRKTADQISIDLMNIFSLYNTTCVTSAAPFFPAWCRPSTS